MRGSSSDSLQALQVGNQRLHLIIFEFCRRHSALRHLFCGMAQQRLKLGLIVCGPNSDELWTSCGPDAIVAMAGVASLSFEDSFSLRRFRIG